MNACGRIRNFQFTFVPNKMPDAQQIGFMFSLCGRYTFCSIEFILDKFNNKIIHSY